MPPVLEITSEMVGPNRPELTRAYLMGVMLLHDDPEERGEFMKTATALHLKHTLGAVPAAEKAVADHVNLWSMALDALPPREIHKKVEARFYQGVLAGEFLGAAVYRDICGESVKLEALKAGMTGRKVHPRANISRSTLVNTILPRFRPVAHLWAAYTYEAMVNRGDQQFPCSLARVPEFLAMAEFFRQRALAMKFRSRRDALLRPNEAWTLPPGLPLPRCDITAIELSNTP